MSKSPKDTKGPIVKTGPTKGQNRSRNNDGSWRGKRSDTGKSRPSKGSSGGGKKGCFLTTAACELRGLPDDCHELETLRRFRDDVLLETPDGRKLVENYYRVAPALVGLVTEADEKDRVWSEILLVVTSIELGDNAGAILGYHTMFERLRRRAAKTRQ
ncbi:MAG: hypothetical protein B7Z31_02440 [Rhodobacterales bacterium 12-65-15]|nr:MAG: hypothetical protein B7Z31_02440 [Rhodobacterales bacterium 12-65-15]